MVHTLFSYSLVHTGLPFTLLIRCCWGVASNGLSFWEAFRWRRPKTESRRLWVALGLLQQPRKPWRLSSSNTFLNECAERCHHDGLEAVVQILRGEEIAAVACRKMGSEEDASTSMQLSCSSIISTGPLLTPSSHNKISLLLKKNLDCFICQQQQQSTASQSAQTKSAKNEDERLTRRPYTISIALVIRKVVAELYCLYLLLSVKDYYERERGHPKLEMESDEVATRTISSTTTTTMTKGIWCACACAAN